MESVKINYLVRNCHYAFQVAANHNVTLLVVFLSLLGSPSQGSGKGLHLIIKVLGSANWVQSAYSVATAWLSQALKFKSGRHDEAEIVPG